MGSVEVQTLLSDVVETDEAPEDLERGGAAAKTDNHSSVSVSMCREVR